MAKVSGGTKLKAPGAVVSGSIPMGFAYSRIAQKIISAVEIWKRNNWRKSRETEQIKPIKIGVVDTEVKNALSEMGIHLITDDIYMTADSIRHTLRTIKEDKNLAITAEDLSTFPKRMMQMDVYYDGKDKDNGIVFMDNKAKYILKPNREYRKNVWVIQWSARKLGTQKDIANEFNEGNKMRLIKKGITK